MPPLGPPGIYWRKVRWTPGKTKGPSSIFLSRCSKTPNPQTVDDDCSHCDGWQDDGSSASHHVVQACRWRTSDRVYCREKLHVSLISSVPQLPQKDCITSTAKAFNLFFYFSSSTVCWPVQEGCILSFCVSLSEVRSTVVISDLKEKEKKKKWTKKGKQDPEKKRSK